MLGDRMEDSRRLGVFPFLALVGSGCLCAAPLVCAQGHVNTWGVTVADSGVVAWGDNYSGQGDVPALSLGLTYVEVAAGGRHTVARRSDGSVVAWGSNYYGECNVLALPPGLTYVEVSAAELHTVARRSD